MAWGCSSVGERLFGVEEVEGSNPSSSTKSIKGFRIPRSSAGNRKTIRHMPIGVASVHTLAPKTSDNLGDVVFTNGAPMRPVVAFSRNATMSGVAGGWQVMQTRCPFLTSCFRYKRVTQILLRFRAFPYIPPAFPALILHGIEAPDWRESFFPPVSVAPSQ